MNRFGEYVLYEQLGTSERGTVHRATVATGDTTARAVAIKRFPTSRFPTEEAATRHAAEIARVSQLRHPNIVAVYRVGRLGDTTYVEMEHVAGISLEELLHEIRTDGPPSIDVAVSLIAELGDALDHAHRQGVVHGDINPCHLLVDSRGSLRLLGFGMAQLGTPLTERCYAAPESTSDEPPEVPGDIYSLGVIAYELLTGQPLFDEHMDLQLRSYLGSCIPPPSSCNPDCPRELDAVVLRALATEPGERWPSARDMCSALLPFGGAAPERVADWIDQQSFAAYPPAAMSTVGTPTAMPPPKRAARGSGSLPSPAEANAVSNRDELYEAETVIRPAATTRRRELRLPLAPPSEPYVELDVDDADSATVVKQDSSVEADGRSGSPSQRARSGDAVPNLGERGSAISGIAEAFDEPSDEPDRQVSASLLLPLPESRGLPRFAELGLAFLAGAVAMYLLIALLS